MKDKKQRYLIVSILFLTAACCLGFFAAGYYLKRQRTERHYTALRDEREDEEGEEQLQWNGIEIPSLRIDWAGYMLSNPDIFSYLYIPNTRVDNPVAEHPAEDTWYLTHNLDNDTTNAGSFYTHCSVNRKLSGQNTVVYGNDMQDGSKFGTLSYFDNADFFDRTPYIFLYTPSKVFIYEVFAAYRYNGSSAPVPESFSSSEEFKDYLSGIFTGKDKNAHFRRDTKVALNEDARILSLTAVDHDETAVVYVVQGVLLNGAEVGK